MGAESNKILITIAILNCNGVQRLKKVIPSILAQDYDPKEIIVLDNASQDDSVEYLRQFKEIKIIEKETNIGYGAGKNALVKNATGSYVFMLDNDVELPESNFLSKIYEEYKTLSNPAFLSPLLLDTGKDYIDTGGLYFNRINRKIKVMAILGTGIKKVPRYRGGACFFKKDVFLELGGFDEIYPINIDDYDMSARAYLAGYTNYRTTNLLCTHHGADTRTNLDALCWKIQYDFSGFSRLMWKNYKLANLLFWWPISAAWLFVKTLIRAIRYSSIRPILAFLKSGCFFVGDLGDTLKQRRKIQAGRMVKEDVFLKIKYARPH